jgi:hypothetical protein
MERLKEKVYCHSCRRKTNHGIIYEHTTYSKPSDPIQWQQRYGIIQCLGCDNVGFVVVYGDEEQWEIDEFGERVWYDTYTVYPEEPKQIGSDLASWNNIEARYFEKVPDFISELYNQVVSVYNLKSNLLCAIGLRTIIEAICKDVNVQDGYIYNEDGSIKEENGRQVRSSKLVGKINGLMEKQLITINQTDILHQVRELGNYAVHEIKNPTRSTLRKGIEVIEHILISIYEMDNLKVFAKK